MGRYETSERLEAEYAQLERDYQKAAEQRTRYREALEAILTFDAFQGGPIAPRENPTTQAMRNIAGEALRNA